MANLINCYYYQNPEHIHKFNNRNVIPGDLVIKLYIEAEIISHDTIEEIWIVDLEKNMHKLDKCENCYYFHITENEFNNYLGRHWKKYKKRYFDLGCAFSYDSRNNCKYF
jgi:hypothetical protein